MRFDSRILEDVEMITRSSDGYIDGRFVKGSESSITIKASVQPMGLAEKQRLAEGFREKEVLKLYSEVTSVQRLINDAEPIQDAAEFGVNGKRYSMIGIEQRKYLIPHYKIVVVAI